MVVPIAAEGILVDVSVDVKQFSCSDFQQRGEKRKREMSDLLGCWLCWTEELRINLVFVERPRPCFAEFTDLARTYLNESRPKKATAAHGYVEH